MEFKNLKLDNSRVCECMQGAVETNSDIFMRRIGAKKLKAGDFKVKIEREDTVDGETCDEFCGQREVSINNVDRYNKEEIVEDYKNRLMEQKKYAPNIEFYYSEFRFKEKAGMIKHTPHHGHESHYDFYKDDGFTIDMLDQVGETSVVKFKNELFESPSTEEENV